MEPAVNLMRSSQRLIVDGTPLTPGELDRRISAAAGERELTLLSELRDFLAEWFAPTDTMTVCTSGSTGVPKPIEVSKERMIQSALTTCRYLRLQPADSALLCMPVRYIAGRMMVVRAMVAGLNLIIAPPSGHPLSELDAPIDFAAMIPLQVFNSLANEDERHRLAGISRLIIGGGPIDDHLAQLLHDMPGEVYATYGMTETLSHVALRRISGVAASERYYPLEGVSLSLSPDDTLIIDAPRVAAQRLVTNDVVRLYPDGGFVILGRRDNIINSGGIKVQSEEVERELRRHLAVPFAITALPDERLGEAITLIVQSDSELHLDDALARLPRYWRPRHVIFTSALPMTATGKVDRAACRLMARQKEYKN
jgi:O-succinylbenzoic acid--CoA ligase